MSAKIATNEPDNLYFGTTWEVTYYQGEGELAKAHRLTFESLRSARCWYYDMLTDKAIPRVELHEVKRNMLMFCNIPAAR